MQEDSTGNSKPPLSDPSVELGSHRTSMSFTRTAMSSDRTLMSVVRTSLSLIAFGFTIFSFFHTLSHQYLEGRIPAAMPRRFGLALVVLGVILLSLGIVSHLRETKSRRERRQLLFEKGLIRHSEPIKVSNVMVIAILLLLVGLVATIHVGISVFTR